MRYGRGASPCSPRFLSCYFTSSLCPTLRATIYIIPIIIRAELGRTGEREGNQASERVVVVSLSLCMCVSVSVFSAVCVFCCCTAFRSFKLQNLFFYTLQITFPFLTLHQRLGRSCCATDTRLSFFLPASHLSHGVRIAVEIRLCCTRNGGEWC